MKRKNTTFRGLWFGLIGLIVGLALGSFGSGILGQRGLLGSLPEPDPKGIELEAFLQAAQVERVSQLDKNIEDKAKELREKIESGTTTPEDMGELQKVLNQRSQAFEMTLRLLQKDSQTKSTIIQNMR
jgi:hypothetical protein